jgi:Rap guanine nucleotide exchange factor 1
LFRTRSRLLEQENIREREKYMDKFLKIMKVCVFFLVKLFKIIDFVFQHLKKMNNFNSYLAILSAVDSGPVQRLDWSKNIIEV